MNNNKYKGVKANISDDKVLPEDPTNILHLENRVRVFNAVLDAYVQICYDIKQLEKNGDLSSAWDKDAFDRLNKTKDNLKNEMQEEVEWLAEYGGSSTGQEFIDAIDNVVKSEIEHNVLQSNNSHHGIFICARNKELFIDMDGTILYNKYPGFGKVIPGCAETLKMLKEKGYRIVIFTARLTNKPLEEKDKIAKYLTEHDIIFDDITNIKRPSASLFIDDRAISVRPDSPWPGDFVERVEKKIAEHEKKLKANKNIKSYMGVSITDIQNVPSIIMDSFKKSHRLIKNLLPDRVSDILGDDRIYFTIKSWGDVDDELSQEIYRILKGCKFASDIIMVRTTGMAEVWLDFNKIEAGYSGYFPTESDQSQDRIVVALEEAYKDLWKRFNNERNDLMQKWNIIGAFIQLMTDNQFKSPPNSDKWIEKIKQTLKEMMEDKKLINDWDEPEKFVKTLHYIYKNIDDIENHPEPFENENYKHIESKINAMQNYMNNENYEKLCNMQIKCKTLWEGRAVSEKQIEELEKLDTIRTTLHSKMVEDIIRDNGLTNGIYDSVHRGLALMMEEDYNSSQQNRTEANIISSEAIIYPVTYKELQNEEIIFASKNIKSSGEDESEFWEEFKIALKNNKETNGTLWKEMQEVLQNEDLEYAKKLLYIAQKAEERHTQSYYEQWLDLGVDRDMAREWKDIPAPSREDWFKMKREQEEKTKKEKEEYAESIKKWRVNISVKEKFKGIIYKEDLGIMEGKNRGEIKEKLNWDELKKELEKNENQTAYLNVFLLPKEQQIKSSEAIIYPAWWIAPDRKVFFVEEADTTHAEWVIGNVDIVKKYIPDIEEFLDVAYDEEEEDIDDDDIYEHMYINGWTRVRRYGGDKILLQIDFPDANKLKYVEYLIDDQKINYADVGLSLMGGNPLTFTQDMLMEEDNNLSKIYQKYKSGVYSAKVNRTILYYPDKKDEIYTKYGEILDETSDYYVIQHKKMSGQDVWGPEKIDKNKIRVLKIDGAERRTLSSMYHGKINTMQNYMNNEMIIEYITRDLFKGQSLQSAVNKFIKKFKNKDNYFLGEINYTPEELYDMVLTDKAKYAIEGAKKMKEGKGYISLVDTSDRFNIPIDILKAKILELTGGKDINGIISTINAMQDYINIVLDGKKYGVLRRMRNRYGFSYKKVAKSIDTDLTEKSFVEHLEQNPDIKKRFLDGEVIKANIIDYPKPGLDNNVWDDDNKLKDNIKNNILKKIKDFFTEKGINNEAFDKVIDKIIIVGSLTSYQWNSKSDLDVHLRVNIDKMRDTLKNGKNMSDEEIYELLDKDWKKEIEKYFVPNTKHPLEYYFEIDGLSDMTYGDGVYNVLTDEWEQSPRTIDVDFNPDEVYQDAMNEAYDLMKEFDITISDMKKDIVDVGLLKDTIKKFKDDDKKKFAKQLSDKINSIEEKINDIVEKGKVIIDDRKNGYSPESEENIKFKTLQRYKYIWLVKNLEKALEDEKTEIIEVEDIKDVKKVRKVVEEFDKIDKVSPENYAKTELVEAAEEKTKQRYGCLMVKMPAEISKAFKKFAKDNIKESDLYYSNKFPYISGVPDITHATVIFGLLLEDITELKTYLKPVTIQLGKIIKFEGMGGEDYDALVCEVDSDDLKALNKKISKNFENHQTFSEYLVHSTLAYVKKGSCDNLLGQFIMPEEHMGVESKFVLNEFIYKSPKGKKFEFEISNVKSAYQSSEVYDGSEDQCSAQENYFPMNLSNLEDYLYDKDFMNQVMDLLQKKGFNNITPENIYDPNLKQQVNVTINEILQEKPQRNKSNSLIDTLDDLDTKNWISHW